MTAPGNSCFHCGEPLPDESPITAYVAGAERFFCCYGCQAVSNIIRNEGLEQFYLQRDAPTLTPEPLDDRVREECLNYDSELLQSDVVQHREDGLSETWLTHLVWDPAITTLGQLLLGIRELGYSAAPFRPSEWKNRIRAEQKQALNDQPRADARDTLNALRRKGYRLVMLSGDHSPQVASIAESLGLDEWRGRCTPEDKLAFIRALEAKGQRVIQLFYAQ